MSDLWNSLVDGMGAILAFLYSIIPNYGFAIIGLTVLVRLVLFPLTAKQARSMQKMQVIQPEIKKLQARYKDDKQKLNEEIMKFYKENKINPMAGCLPLVAQMPIFFALFNVLRSPLRHIPVDSKLFEAFCGTATRANCKPKGLGFLGMDLSKAASEPHGGFTDALPYFVLIGLVVLTGYLQFKQTQSRQGTQANPQMAIMGKIFPVMFAFISFNMPAGVVLYFLVSNAWQIGQQALIFGSILPSEPPALRAPVVDVPSEGPRPGGAKKQPADGNSSGNPVVEGQAPKPKPDTPKNPGGPSSGLGRAQPSGSQPRPKKKRR